MILQVGPKGKVIGIDHIKELVDDSISNVKKDDPSLITSGRIKLIGEKISRYFFCMVFEHVLGNIYKAVITANF